MALLRVTTANSSCANHVDTARSLNGLSFPFYHNSTVLLLVFCRHVKPQLPSFDWQMRMSSTTGNWYYANAKLGATQWQRPVRQVRFCDNLDIELSQSDGLCICTVLTRLGFAWAGRAYARKWSPPSGDTSRWPPSVICSAWSRRCWYGTPTRGSLRVRCPVNVAVCGGPLCLCSFLRTFCSRDTVASLLCPRRVGIYCRPHQHTHLFHANVYCAGEAADSIS